MTMSPFIPVFSYPLPSSVLFSLCYVSVSLFNIAHRRAHEEPTRDEHQHSTTLYSIVRMLYFLLLTTHFLPLTYTPYTLSLTLYSLPLTSYSLLTPYTLPTRQSTVSHV
ncbi:hypothetical protein F5Y07DRAFT_201667 [Xylaria sp. FL0933]|nr:hypothetical protein F5Y07DRAFT_201667 [Xylaria sp. FL0933]